MAEPTPDTTQAGADASPPDWPQSPAPAHRDDGAGPSGDGDGAPGSYAAFTLPDGVSVDEATLDEARALFAGAGLPQAEAQRFVDFYAGRIRALAEAPHRIWAETQAQWVGDINRDGEIGGSRLKSTVEAAGKAIDAFGSPRLREVLDFTGAGNHPEVVRFFARVGRAISEDGHIPGAAARATKSTAEIMFPTMQQQE
jgi:hypothetical protein